MKQFKPMRSCKIEDRHPVTFPKLASYKLDGIRMAKYAGQDRTKSGKPVPNKYTSNWIRENLPDGWDTEMILGQANDEGVYSRTYSAVMSHEGEPEITFYAFDICDDLNNYKTERIAGMAEKYDRLPLDVQKRIVLVQQMWINSQEELDAHYDSALALGYEGLILCDPQGLYLYGKSSPLQQTQLKLKPDEDEEATITGVYEGLTNNNQTFTNEVGETKRSTHAENKTPNGRLGGFNCVKDGVSFNVGPGKLKHSELVTLWNEHLANPGCHNGRIIKYAHLGYGTMANGAPRHPRWIGWRGPVDMEPTNDA